MIKLYRDPGEQTIAKVTLGDQPPTVAVSLVEDVSVNACRGIIIFIIILLVKLCYNVCVCVHVYVCMYVYALGPQVTDIYIP